MTTEPKSAAKWRARARRGKPPSAEAMAFCDQHTETFDSCDGCPFHRPEEVVCELDGRTFGQMIVKVQLTAKRDRVLVYNEVQTTNFEGPSTSDIRRLMGSRRKAFFFAKMRGTLVELGADAPWQDW